MEKVDYGLFMCFAKGISERGDIDWGEGDSTIKNLSKFSFMQRQNPGRSSCFRGYRTLLCNSRKLLSF